MGARADLLRAAEQAASRAVADGANWLERETDLSNAKTALEAAALAENVTAGQIDTALGEIQDLLEEGGVLEKSVELPPGEFLRQTFGALLVWRKEALNGRNYQVAYDELRELLEGLERDFVAGDTETSRRIAGRIRTRLDSAAQLANYVPGEGADDEAQE